MVGQEKKTNKENKEEIWRKDSGHAPNSTSAEAYFHNPDSVERAKCNGLFGAVSEGITCHAFKNKPQQLTLTDQDVIPRGPTLQNCHFNISGSNQLEGNTPLGNLQQNSFQNMLLFQNQILSSNHSVDQAQSQITNTQMNYFNESSANEKNLNPFPSISNEKALNFLPVAKPKIPIFRKKQRFSFEEIAGERLDYFEWQMSDSLFKTLKTKKFISQEFDAICEDLYDELEECEFASLILPVQQKLKNLSPRFYKSCEKLSNYSLDKDLLENVLRKEPYLSECI